MRRCHKFHKITILIYYSVVHVLFWLTIGGWFYGLSIWPRVQILHEKTHFFFLLPRTLRKYPNVLVEFFAPWYLQFCILITLNVNFQWNARCPACVNFNTQLQRLQTATKNIPLKVVKVSEPNIRITRSKYLRQAIQI